jgi:hypothetical protein
MEYDHLAEYDNTNNTFALFLVLAQISISDMISIDATETQFCKNAIHIVENLGREAL